VNIDSHIIFVTFVAIVALITVIFMLRARHKNNKVYLPEFDEVDDILAPLSEIKDDFNSSPTWIEKNSKSPSKSKQAEETLAELGFSSLDGMFTANSHETRVEPVANVATTTLMDKEPFNNDLIVIHVMAKPGNQFIGYELLQALLAAGLHYGEMSIFHRYQDPESGGKKLFSLASATEPGIFDMNKMGIFVCKGLSLFMQLTGPEHSLPALELLVMTAQQLSEDLDGQLLDSKHQPITEEKISDYQMRIKRYQERIKNNASSGQTLSREAAFCDEGSR
jgi:cell division protein ZipA